MPSKIINQEAVVNFSEHNSIVNQYIAELRSASVQKDSLRFRKNLERLGEIFAYEISKTLPYKKIQVETPLGSAAVNVPDQRIVLATILRAGLPMHQGMLNIFDKASNAFVSAYRLHHKDGTFEINLEYASCPKLDGAVLIICDPMIATGASMALALDTLRQSGEPEKIHIVTAIASTAGLNHMRRMYPQAQVWMGALDEELTAKSYIVPGLGDAGDLAFGEKLQE
ncbi:MAG TPA: uracil phosphoribosyltransferase [Saprospiraceae bacterium]|nr:uracil phosphoribosyltransferase [Saprospiraceae bacterium]